MTSDRANARTNFYPYRDRSPSHRMLHARVAHWQTPITEAPPLYERSPIGSDPSFDRRLTSDHEAFTWLAL